MSFTTFLYSFNKYHNTIESFHHETQSNTVSHACIILKSIIADLNFFNSLFSSALIFINYSFKFEQILIIFAF